MATYPQEVAQDAAYQSHTNRLTGLWFLPKLAQGLNNNNNNNNNNCYYYYYYYYHHHHHQNKVLRAIVNAPWYIGNKVLHAYLKVPTIREEITKFNVKYRGKITTHTNEILSTLLE